VTKIDRLLPKKKGDFVKQCIEVNKNKVVIKIT